MHSMDITAFLEKTAISSPSLILLTLFFFLFIIHTKRSSWRNIKGLPPGPPRLPIIGNLHQVGDKPHESITKLSNEYGPLISLRLGMQVLVVASSPEAAMEILKTQDRLLCDRTVPTAFQQKSLLPHSLLWSDCNETWRSLKTLCHAELFSSKALDAYSGIRQEKLDQMLDFLRIKQGQVINIEKVLFTTLFNTLSCMVLGKDLLDLENEYETSGGLRESLLNILEYGGRVKDFGSFFPMFQRFDLQGIRKGSMKNMQKAFSFWEDIIEHRRAQISSSSWSLKQSKTFLDRLLEDKFSNNQINQLITELFIAGTNTTTTALVWAITELLRNKDTRIKMEEEMKRETNSSKINESQLSKLPFLQACIKESLRLHPPVPFLLPHKAIETCDVMNFMIPKNARIFVNVWAMGRDPKVWDDPLAFRPERFLRENKDFRDQDFMLLPFGSGRRMCPGLPFGRKSMEVILASLVHEFDWVLPHGEDPLKLNMDDRFVITLKKENPLKLIFKHKHATSMA